MRYYGNEFLQIMRFEGSDVLDFASFQSRSAEARHRYGGRGNALVVRGEYFRRMPV